MNSSYILDYSDCKHWKRMGIVHISENFRHTRCYICNYNFVTWYFGHQKVRGSAMGNIAPCVPEVLKNIYNSWKPDNRIRPIIFKIIF